MNKKILFSIPVIIAVIVYLVLPKNSEKIGNKCEAKIPDISYADKEVELTNLNIYTDFSGSMKGFVDFSKMDDGESVRNIFTSTISKFLDNVENSYNTKIDAYVGNLKQNKNQLVNIMQTGKGFNKNTTLLHDILQKAASTINDSSVAVVVSDMLLSYGKKELLAQKDTFYNKHHLDALGAKVHSVMSEIHGKNYDVVILQYLSSFNGKYYYNYTENLKGTKAYNNMHMKDRPFYITLIGSQEILKAIIEKELIDSANNIYTTFENLSEKDLVTSNFIITESSSKNANVWRIGQPDPKEQDLNKNIGIWRESKYEHTSTIKISCPSFKIPNWIGYKNVISGECPSSSVSSINNIIYDKKNGISFDVNLIEYTKMPKKDNICISLIEKSSWFNEISIDDDVARELVFLEGKTWGFNYIIESIEKAFYTKGRPNAFHTLGIFNFEIIKK